MDIKLQSDQAFDYTPGDTIGVICENNEADILGLCKQIEMERPLSIICKVYLDPETKKARAKLPEHIPTIGPLRSLLFSCIDVRSVPKKLFIRSLVDYTCDIKEKRRLEELCSKQVTFYFKYFFHYKLESDLWSQNIYTNLAWGSILVLESLLLKIDDYFF